MATLASKTALGGVIGDDYTDSIGQKWVIATIFADGVYAWNEAEEDGGTGNSSVLVPTIANSNVIGTHISGSGASTDIAETVTGLTIVGDVLTYTKEDGTTDTVDLSPYIDDTNLARLVSGSLNPTTGILTVTRDDASTFTIDLSGLLDVNFATTDLTFTGDRNHNLNGNVFNLFSFGAGSIYVDSAIARLDFAGTNSFNANADGVEFDISAGSDFQINNDAGTAGQVLQSNGPNNPPTWETAAAGGSILTSDQTADTNHTQNFNDFAQVWNNLGGLQINQALSAFPGAYGSTTWSNGGLEVTAQNGAGSNTVLDLNPGTFDITSTLGSGEAGRVEFDGVTMELTYDGSAIGGQLNSFGASDDGLGLTIGASSDFQINNDAGASGQVLQSNGPNLPPTWETLGDTYPAAAAEVQTGSVSLTDADSGKMFLKTDDGSGNAVSFGGVTAGVFFIKTAPGLTNTRATVPGAFNKTIFNADGTVFNTLGTGTTHQVTLPLADTIYRIAASGASWSAVPISTVSTGGGGQSIFDADQTMPAPRLHELDGHQLTFNQNPTGFFTSAQFAIGTNFVTMLADGAQLRLTQTGLNIVLQGTDHLELDGNPGTAGQVLMSQGAGVPPIWGGVAAGGDNLFDANLTLGQDRTHDLNGFDFFLNDTGRQAQFGLFTGIPFMGKNNNAFRVNSDSIDLFLDASSDLQINGDPGTAGQVLQSNGADSPPTWVTPAGASGDSLFDIDKTLLAARTHNLNSFGFTLYDAISGYELTIGPSEVYIRQGANGGFFVDDAEGVQIKTSSDLKINSDPGLNGEVLQSKGTATSPQWAYPVEPFETLATMPAPGAYNVGAMVSVINDGANNGVYLATGAPLGNPAVSWEKQ